jgi:hypothetical protein
MRNSTTRRLYLTMGSARTLCDLSPQSDIIMLYGHVTMVFLTFPSPLATNHPQSLMSSVQGSESTTWELPYGDGKLFPSQA